MRDLPFRMNVGIIAVHTELSAIFGNRSVVAYDRGPAARQRLAIVGILGEDNICRLRPEGLRPEGLKRAVVAIVL